MTQWEECPAPRTPESGDREFREDFNTEFHEVDGASIDLRPDAISVDHHTAFTLGPVELADPSEGLLARVWRAQVESDTVMVCSAWMNNGGWNEPVPLFHVDDGLGPLTEIDFAFEQTGNPVVCAERPTGPDGSPEVWVYFYDATIPGPVFRNFGPGRTPRALLDRPLEIGDSDVCVFYVDDEAGRIVYRQQRERYETVHPTPAGRILGSVVERGWRIADEFRRFEIGPDWTALDGEWQCETQEYETGHVDFLGVTGSGGFLRLDRPPHRRAVAEVEFSVGPADPDFAAEPFVDYPGPSLFYSFDPGKGTGIEVRYSWRRSSAANPGGGTDPVTNPAYEVWRWEAGIAELVLSRRPMLSSIGATAGVMVAHILEEDRLRCFRIDPFGEWTEEDPVEFAPLPAEHSGHLHLGAHGDPDALMRVRRVRAVRDDTLEVEGLRDGYAVGFLRFGGVEDTVISEGGRAVRSLTPTDRSPALWSFTGIRVTDEEGFVVGHVEAGQGEAWSDEILLPGDRIRVFEKAPADENTFIEDVAKREDRRVVVLYSRRDRETGRYTLHQLTSTLMPIIADIDSVTADASIQQVQLDRLILDALAGTEALTAGASLQSVEVREPVIVVELSLDAFTAGASMLSVELIDLVIRRSVETEALTAGASLESVAVDLVITIDVVIEEEALTAGASLQSVILEAA